MNKKLKQYDCLGDIYDYNYYIIKSKKDLYEILSLIKKEQEILSNNKISTKKWANHKVLIWGMFQSIKNMPTNLWRNIEVNICCATNDLPFNNYSYNIKIT